MIAEHEFTVVHRCGHSTQLLAPDSDPDYERVAREQEAQRLCLACDELQQAADALMRGEAREEMWPLMTFAQAATAEPDTRTWRLVRVLNVLREPEASPA